MSSTELAQAVKVTASVTARFLISGERVHAFQSRTTWDGQVVTVDYVRVRTAPSVRGDVVVICRDAADRPCSFVVPAGEKVRLVN